MKTKIESGALGVFPKKEIARVYQCLKQIETKHRAITPAIVVQEAKKPRHALHHYFTWDDTLAAQKWREQQARLIICNVMVKFRDSEGKEQSVRAFVNVSPREDELDDIIDGRGYISAQRSVDSSNYQEQVLAYAYHMLLGWKKRFGSYKQFAGITNEIEKVNL